tara:strand:+ start:3446 stop:5050 length:1605 start_codon:yes stop_codon:yes gene_type:complete
MLKDIKKFLAEEEKFSKPLWKATALAWWGKETTGEENYSEIAQVLSETLEKRAASPERFSKIKNWYSQIDKIDDSDVRRIIESLYLGAIGSQKNDEEISKTVKLGLQISSDYVKHRGIVDGEEKSSNDLSDILKQSSDNSLSEKAWKATKTIGEKVEGKLLDLVETRNSSAKRMGFKNYYSMRLITQEVNEDFLFNLLDELDELTREPFLAHKRKYDSERAQRYNINKDEIMPWHYENPYFQSVPFDTSVGDKWFVGKEDDCLEKLAIETFDSCGLDIRSSIEKSDLYEREGKSQHAFCLGVDDPNGDVRVLCNLRNNLTWGDTVLHEYGHAIYDLLATENLPWFLQGPAHINSTEAIAMIFGRQALRPEWLIDFLEAPSNEVNDAAVQLVNSQRFKMLAFSRWEQVMCRFEKELYSNPKQDLNQLWWDLKEEYQDVRKPKGRNKPDWAAKNHIATAPVYYHNYMLGEMTASQLEHDIIKKTGSGLLKNKKAGKYLANMFSFGSRLKWDDLVKEITGEELSPRCWAEDFAKAPE